jgi:DNA-damage-inducible protein J
MKRRFGLLQFIKRKDKKRCHKPLIPNEETIDAMKDARRGELATVNNINNLLENLNIKDERT